MHSHRLPRARGFTLIELLVSLAVMAVLALLSWQGLDGMVRARQGTQDRMDSVVTLQTGLAQWTADLEAIAETPQVSAIDYDGRVLRLTRRDSVAADSPLRVVGWARRVIDDQHGGKGSWARWLSPPVRTRAELQEAWARAQLWAQNASDAEKRREVAVAGIDQWQVFYFRNDAWTNPLSTAGTPSVPTGFAALNSTAVPLPDGVRVVLTLSAGQSLAGVITRDWIRPVLGGGKN